MTHDFAKFVLLHRLSNTICCLSESLLREDETMALRHQIHSIIFSEMCRDPMASHLRVPFPILWNGEPVTTPKDIAKGFNQYFASSIPLVTGTDASQPQNTNNPALSTVTSGVKSIARNKTNCKLGNRGGPDGIPPKAVGLYRAA